MARCENMLSVITKIVLIFILYSTSVFAGDILVRFPGKINQIFSPKNGYVLYNVDYDSSIDSAENYHSLFLENVKNNNKNRIYNYGRFVEILWSPNDKNLAITDYGGSDFADCLIFKPNDPVKKISIHDELKQQVPTNKTIFKQPNDKTHFNDHVYITCNKWLADNTVLIRIYGHGDINPHGFTLWYKYTLGEKFKSVK